MLLQTNKLVVKFTCFNAVGRLQPQLLHVPPEHEHLQDLLVLGEIDQKVLERVGGHLVGLQRRYDPPVLRPPPQLLVTIQHFLLRIFLLRRAPELFLYPHRTVVDLDRLLRCQFFATNNGFLI